ncbi:MAG: hypothetical protein WBN23_13095, partial [Woeseia sp.]
MLLTELYTPSYKKGRSMITCRHVLGIFFALLLPITVNAQQALTIEEVVAMKSVASVHMNPGGDRIAYTLSVPRELYVDDDGPSFEELHVVDLLGNSTP